MSLPVIFVFDLDETMIGVSTPLSSLTRFHTFLYNAIKAQKISPTLCNGKKIHKISLAHVLPPEMLRPGFKDAAHSIKIMYPTAEFFVYSAGTAPYVTDVISWVEKIADVKFRRPLLTRNHTMISESSSVVKSLDIHMDIILDTLLEDYPALSFEYNRNIVAACNIVHIDDRHDVLWEGSSKLINCPAYSYTPFIDITAGLDKCVVRSDVVQEYLRQEERGDAFIEPTHPLGSPEERELQFHLFMAEKYRQVSDINCKHLTDDFFARLTSTLKGLKHLKRPFTKKNVKAINEFIRQPALKRRRQ